MKKLYLLLAVVAVAAISCSKQELDDISIDMSYEIDSNYYVYYKFINKTGTPLYIEYVEKYSDIGSSYFIDNKKGFVGKVISNNQFLSPEEAFNAIIAKYNKRKNDIGTVYKVIYKSAVGRSPMALESWTEEVIDNNSIIRTYTFSKEDYEYAKKYGEKLSE